MPFKPRPVRPSQPTSAAFTTTAKWWGIPADARHIGGTRHSEAQNILRAPPGGAQVGCSSLFPVGVGPARGGGGGGGWHKALGGGGGAGVQPDTSAPTTAPLWAGEETEEIA